MIVFAALVGLACARGAAAADAEEARPGLAGVPDEIIGRIIDTTTLYAARTFYTSPDAAAIATHIIHQAKEMPWHHGYLRRRQRRMYPAAAHIAAPTALAEVDASSAGRLRYRLNLSGGGDGAYGSLTAGGLAATDDFTQGLGSRTETSLSGRAGTRGQRATADIRAAWSLTSLNWRTTAGKATARDRTAVDLGVLVNVGPPARRGSSRLSAEGSLYRLAPPSGPAGGDDAIAEVRVSAEFDVNRAGRPVTLAIRGVGRRTEDPATDGITSTGLATVSLADHFAGGPLGVFDWRLAAAAYGQPTSASGAASTTEVAAPFELGWATAAGPVGLRVHAGYSVALPPIALYTDTDHVAVNSTLPARTAWNGGASLWARIGSFVLSGEAGAEDVAGLPVWREETVVGEDGPAIAWRPVAVDARLLAWRVRLSAPRGPHATFTVSVAGEATEPAAALHLPYRPAVTATGEARFQAPADARVRLTARHVGRRYRSELDPTGMDGYTRFGVRVTRAVTAGVDVFVAGEATAGTYQVFEAGRDGAWHALSQGGFGVGFTGRI